jgi:hypothetical protein
MFTPLIRLADDPRDVRQPRVHRPRDAGGAGRIVRIFDGQMVAEHASDRRALATQEVLQ